MQQSIVTMPVSIITCTPVVGVNGTLMTRGIGTVNPQGRRGMVRGGRVELFEKGC